MSNSHSHSPIQRLPSKQHSWKRLSNGVGVQQELQLLEKADWSSDTESHAETAIVLQIRHLKKKGSPRVPRSKQESVWGFLW